MVAVGTAPSSVSCFLWLAGLMSELQTFRHASLARPVPVPSGVAGLAPSSSTYLGSSVSLGLVLMLPAMDWYGRGTGAAPRRGPGLLSPVSAGGGVLSDDDRRDVPVPRVAGQHDGEPEAAAGPSMTVVPLLFHSLLFQLPQAYGINLGPGARERPRSAPFRRRGPGTSDDAHANGADGQHDRANQAGWLTARKPRRTGTPCGRRGPACSGWCSSARPA